MCIECVLAYQLTALASVDVLKRRVVPRLLTRTTRKHFMLACMHVQCMHRCKEMECTSCRGQWKNLHYLSGRASSRQTVRAEWNCYVSSSIHVVKKKTVAYSNPKQETTTPCMAGVNYTGMYKHRTVGNMGEELILASWRFAIKSPIKTPPTIYYVGCGRIHMVMSERRMLRYCKKVE